MQIEFLGTGAGSPGKFRNVSSLALRYLKNGIQFGCLMPVKARSIKSYGRPFGHVKLIKYLLPTCTATIFLVCLGC